MVNFYSWELFIAFTLSVWLAETNSSKTPTSLLDAFSVYGDRRPVRFARFDRLARYLRFAEAF